jgi:hypothetical protein
LRTRGSEKKLLGKFIHFWVADRSQAVMRTLHLELGTHAEQTRMTRLRRIHRQTNQTKGHERSKRELASSALHNDLLLYYFQKMGKKIGFCAFRRS